MSKNSSHYELIYDFILNSSPNMSLEELADRFVEITGNSLPVKLLGVFVFRDDAGELIRVSGGYSDGRRKTIVKFDKPLKLKEGEGIVWEVFRRKESLVVHEPFRHPQYYISKEEEPYVGQNAFILPLEVNGRVKGVLYIEKDEPFSDSEKKFFLGVKRILEKTFENSELVTKLRMEREEKNRILNSISYPIFLVDREFRIRGYNKFFLEMFGVHPGELKHKKCYEIVERTDKVPDNCPLFNLLEGKKNATSKINVKNKIFEASIFTHKSVYGEELFVHTIKDITELERKKRNLNLLYRVGLSLTTSVSIDEFRMKVEEFLEQEKEVDVRVFWRDGIENRFDYKKPLIKKVESVVSTIIEPKKSYSFSIDYLGEEVGVLVVSSKDGKKLPLEKVKFYKTFAASVELALQNLYLLEELRRALASLNVNYKATLESLSHALDYREHETEFHSRRVASYAVLIGRKMELTDSELKNIYWGGLLHDLGKIGIPDSILLKPGKLNKDEWEVMKKHPIIGFDILKHIEFLQEALKVVLYHHERWDGKGYPYGLRDSEIPLIARIFAVADTYDAITSDRPYRKALSPDIAYMEIERNVGSQFDPDIAELFLKKVKMHELMEIRKKVQEDIHFSPIE